MVTPGADKIIVENLRIDYGNVRALKGVNFSVKEHEILGVIGPANSGKTSFLRALNRLNDLDPSCKTQGSIRLNGKDINREMDAEEVRKKVTMVFALPIPLPMSIFDNVAYGPRRHGISGKKQLREIVEKSLRAAFLWEEVKDRLDSSGMKLSGGQQQRLCIARTDLGTVFMWSGTFTLPSKDMFSRVTRADTSLVKLAIGSFSFSFLAIIVSLLARFTQ